MEGASNALKRQECVVVHTSTKVYLWRGAAADEATFQAAQAHVKAIQHCEGAPKAVDLWRSGTEPPALWTVLASCGFAVPAEANSFAPNPFAIATQEPEQMRSRKDLALEDEQARAGNKQGFTNVRSSGIGNETTRFSQPQMTPFEKIRMQQLASKEENPEPQSTRRMASEPESSAVSSKVENETDGKLYTYPDWEELDMFDSDDLVTDSAVVLVPNKKSNKCLYVWLGEEFIEDEDRKPSKISAEIGSTFIGKFGMPAYTEVKTEVEGKESDVFWEFFVNG